tara:strand:- start:943 stop:2328 length:1386 start_codon:yes stop_codon:yes gene_type:complete
MAFKMNGWNAGMGTGSAKGLPKKKKASDPAYENFAQDVDKNKKDWSDHPDYNPDYEYDKYGNPIPTNLRVPNYNQELLEYDRFADDYEGAPNHIYGTIDTSDQSGKKSYRLRDDKILNRPGDLFEKQLAKAITEYKEKEEIYGVGNVSRGNMGDHNFDLLLNYGGGDDGLGSWVQERQVAAARGQLDNEPHIIGTDAMMYPNLKEGEVPRLKQMQKNMRDIYKNVMNDVHNADNTLSSYGAGKTESVSKRDAMKLAKDLIPSHSLTSAPTSLRPGDQGLTDEQEDAEVQEVQEEMESPEFNEYVNQDDTMEEGVEEDDSGEEEFDPMDMNKDGYVDKWDRKEYNKMMEEQGQQEEDAPVVEEDVIADDPPVEEEVVEADDPPVEEEVVETEQSFDPRDTNQDGEVDKWELKAAKRAAMFADDSAMSKKPVFGTDEYYSAMKKKRTEEMGLTKRMFNIYDKE